MENSTWMKFLNPKPLSVFIIYIELAIGSFITVLCRSKAYSYYYSSAI